MAGQDRRQKLETVMRQEILKQLQQAAEEPYRDFNCKLIPNLKKEQTLGVRIPEIRKLAKKIAKTDWQLYLEELENSRSNPAGTGETSLYHEEIMLWGMIIGAAAMKPHKRLDRIREFLPRIQNWAVCDTFCSDLKFARQEENHRTVWEFLQPCLNDNRTYFLRFAIVMFLSYYIEEAYINEVLEKTAAIRHEDYYVKMAAAWNLSVCYVKFPQKTEQLLKQKRLDPFTHNKTIQKIRESYRISKEDKERLNRLKIK